MADRLGSGFLWWHVRGKLAEEKKQNRRGREQDAAEIQALTNQIASLSRQREDETKTESPICTSSKSSLSSSVSVVYTHGPSSVDRSSALGILGEEEEMQEMAEMQNDMWGIHLQETEKEDVAEQDHLIQQQTQVT